jgi:hypothetical protein
MRSETVGRHEEHDRDEPAGRPILSLLLFFHLFLVFVALSANHFPSALQNRLVGFFSPYLRVLNLELNFTPFHLTVGSVDDQDHRVEVLPTGGMESDPSTWLALPDAGWRGGERYKRYQRLASSMAFFGERDQDNFSALFARSVAESFLNQREIVPVQVRCRRLLPQDRSVVEGGTPEQRDPYSDQYSAEVYRANVLVDGASVSVIKVEEAGQVARPDSGGQQP